MHSIPNAILWEWIKKIVHKSESILQNPNDLSFDKLPNVTFEMSNSGKLNLLFGSYMAVYEVEYALIKE